MKHALNGYNSIAVLNAESALHVTATAADTGFPATSSEQREVQHIAHIATATPATSAVTIRAKALAKKHAPLIVGKLHPSNAERIYAAIEAAVVEALGGVA